MFYGIDSEERTKFSEERMKFSEERTKFSEERMKLILSSLFSFKRIPQMETFVPQKDTYVRLTESVYITFNELR